MTPATIKRRARYDRDMAVVRDFLRGGVHGMCNVRGVTIDIGILFDVRQPDGSWFRYSASPRDIGKVP